MVIFSILLLVSSLLVVVNMLTNNKCYHRELLKLKSNVTAQLIDCCCVVNESVRINTVLYSK